MKTRNLLWMIPLLIFVSAPFWWDFVGVLLAPEERRRSPTAPIEKNFVMTGATMLQCKDGKDEFLLNADRVSSQNGQKVLLFRNVEAVIWNEKQKIDVESREALFDTEKQIVTLMGDVMFNSAEGYELRTTVLRYLSNYKKIKSAAPVKITGKGFRILGTSFYYDLNSGNFRVGRRVLFNLW